MTGVERAVSLIGEHAILVFGVYGRELCVRCSILESGSGKNPFNVYFAKVDGKRREPAGGAVQAGDMDMGTY